MYENAGPKALCAEASQPLLREIISHMLSQTITLADRMNQLAGAANEISNFPPTDSMDKIGGIEAPETSIVGQLQLANRRLSESIAHADYIISHYKGLI